MGLFSGLEKFGLGKLEKWMFSKKKRKEMQSNIRKGSKATDSRRRFIV